MWKCPKCNRLFNKKAQPHSCRKIPLQKHFEGKEKAKELFDYVIKQINKNIGECDIVSIPCCIHLFGRYDFLAVLPKKHGLELRFALSKKLMGPRIKQCVLMSATVFKNCIEINMTTDFNNELIGWLKESYHLKD